MQHHVTPPAVPSEIQALITSPCTSHWLRDSLTSALRCRSQLCHRIDDALVLVEAIRCPDEGEELLGSRIISPWLRPLLEHALRRDPVDAKHDAEALLWALQHTLRSMIRQPTSFPWWVEED